MNTLVQDIMIREVISVRSDMPLLEVAQILGEHKFDGVPVVDENNVLMGILTEYDLISKGSAMHLPTLQTIFQNITVFREDRSRFKKETEEIANIKVADVMNTDPLTLSADDSFEQAVAAFREHHRVNPIPVIDKDKKVVGVVSRYDIVKLFELTSNTNN